MNRREAQRWITWGLLLVVVAVAYFNALEGAFTYDDKVEVIGNRTIRVLDRWKVMLGYNMSRPLTIASYALNYHFAAQEPFLYHLVDVVLFGLEVGLAFLLVSAIAEVRDHARPVMIGALAAGLWAAHPLNTEAVSYVTQRSEQLCALFYLLGCWSFVRWRQVGGLQHFVGAWLAVVAGALTKEVAVTMPAAFLLIELVALRAFDWRAVRWRDHLPGLVGLVAFFGWRWSMYDTLTSPVPPMRPLDVQVFTEFEVWIRYAQLSVVPLGQSVFHDHAETGASARSVAAMLAVLGATGVAIWKAKKHPWLAFCWLWFALILLPSSSFIALKETMAEHRIHLSLIGVTTAAALGLDRLGRRGHIAGGILIFVLAIATILQNRVWQSETALWEQATRRNPASTEAWYGYGDALHLAQEHGLAREAYQRAADNDDDYIDAWINLGREEAELGNREQAEAAWKDALRRSPSDCKAHNNLGLLYARGGEYKKAEQELMTTLQYCPRNCLANRLLGDLYAEYLDNEVAAVGRYNAFLDRCSDDVYAPSVREKRDKLTW